MYGDEKPEHAMTSSQIHASRNLLWHYGDRELGWEPGSFTKNLIRALESADTMNRLRLLTVFPDFHPGVMVLLSRGSDVLAEAVRENVERRG